LRGLVVPGPGARTAQAQGSWRVRWIWIRLYAKRATSDWSSACEHLTSSMSTERDGDSWVGYVSVSRHGAHHTCSRAQACCRARAAEHAVMPVFMGVMWAYDQKRRCAIANTCRVDSGLRRKHVLKERCWDRNFAGRTSGWYPNSRVERSRGKHTGQGKNPEF